MCARNINICFILRNISYKYNKCASFFIEGVPAASVLKSDCAIYVSMIIDLRTLWKVSKAGFVISKDGCRRHCSLKPMKLECVAINKSLIKWLRGREAGLSLRFGFRTRGVSFYSWCMRVISIHTIRNCAPYRGSWPHVPLCLQNTTWIFLPRAAQIKKKNAKKEIKIYKHLSRSKLCKALQSIIHILKDHHNILETHKISICVLCRINFQTVIITKRLKHSLPIGI